MSTNNVCGNAAALREALERVVEIADREWKSFRETSAMKEMRDVCTSALAAPARNCDRYATPDAAERAFDDYCHDRRENPVEVCRRKSCRDCQREWLYAAAKEQGAVDA